MHKRNNLSFVFFRDRIAMDQDSRSVNETAKSDD